MNKLLPLLSDGLIDILKSILKSNESQIASELLEAHNAICAYNTNPYWSESSVDFTLLKQSLLTRINELITDEVRALSIRRDVFEISFTPKGKDLYYSSEGTWSRENRQTGKPGRVIKKLMKFDYKERDIEIFNNLLKAHMIKLNEFRIVDGSDITKYYNEDSYYKCSGSLGNSCMRYEECESYFEIYEDHAKMLVCFRDGLVAGRALVWEIGDKTFMDRVYVCDDYLEDQFFIYAKEHKWCVRENNSLLHSGEDQIWIDPDGNGIYYDVEISLEQHYEYMPYMDSFRYFDPSNNTLHTSASNNRIELDSTDGTYEGFPWACDCCGDVYLSYDEDEIPDELRWSEYEECYLCESCRTYCEGIYDWVRDSTDTTYVYTNRGYLLFPENYVVEKSISQKDVNSLGCIGLFVEIDDEWYACDYLKLTNTEGRITLK